MAGTFKQYRVSWPEAISRGPMISQTFDELYVLSAVVGDFERSGGVLESREVVYGEWGTATASPESSPPRYSDAGRCVRCRHAEHDGFACLNMQSDNDCSCPTSPDSGTST